MARGSRLGCATSEQGGAGRLTTPAGSMTALGEAVDDPIALAWRPLRAAASRAREMPRRKYTVGFPPAAACSAAAKAVVTVRDVVEQRNDPPSRSALALAPRHIRSPFWSTTRPRPPRRLSPRRGHARRARRASPRAERPLGLRDICAAPANSRRNPVAVRERRAIGRTRALQPLARADEADERRPAREEPASWAAGKRGTRQERPRVDAGEMPARPFKSGAPCGTA